MRKYLIFVLCFLFLTGCSVKYDLTIDSKYMTEDISLSLPKTDENVNKINDLDNNKIGAYVDMETGDAKYYESDVVSDDNNITLNLSYKYSKENLKKSQFINNCFYKKNVIKNDEHIIIETQDGIMCKYKDGDEQFDKLVVNIHTSLNVLENNADSVSHGVYTWTFDSNNYSSKNIYIKINYKESSNQWLKNIFNSTVLIIFGIVGVIAVISIIILLINKKNNNKL